MDNKTPFILRTNSYMFLHQVPSSRSIFKTKDHYVHVLQVVVTLTFIIKIKRLEMFLINTLRMAP